MESFDFGEPRQNGFDYPVPLVEKYQPRKIADFIGLEGAKRVFENLLKAPRPVAVLLVGPPGCGKTTPAVRESIEQKKWKLADEGIVEVGRVLAGEAALINSAAAELEKIIK
jgi:replication-associated recombination protein RarA